MSSVEAGEVSKWNLECELAYLLRERGTRSEREKKEEKEEKEISNLLRPTLQWEGDARLTGASSKGGKHAESLPMFI